MTPKKMKKASCKLCGAERSASQEFCSSGCSLASRLPLGDKDLPATWQLGVLMAWLFALFNQLLFSGLTVISIAQDEFERAGAFEVAAIAIGGLVLVWSLFLFLALKPIRWTDFLVLGVALGSGAIFVAALGDFLADPVNPALCIANLMITFWLLRGLWRLKASKKREKN